MPAAVLLIRSGIEIIAICCAVIDRIMVVIGRTVRKIEEARENRTRVLRITSFQRARDVNTRSYRFRMYTRQYTGDNDEHMDISILSTRRRRRDISVLFDFFE